MATDLTELIKKIEELENKFIEDLLANPAHKEAIFLFANELMPDNTPIRVKITTLFYSAVNQYVRAGITTSRQLFSSIPEQEFLSGLINSSKTLAANANYNQFKFDHLRLNYQVQCNILFNPAILKRHLIFSKWVLIAKKFVESYDFHRASAIIFGLSCEPVNRVIDVTILPKEVQETYQKVRDLFIHIENKTGYIILRNFFLYETQVFIPCRHNLQKEMVYLQEIIQNCQQKKEILELKLHSLASVPPPPENGIFNNEFEKSEDNAEQNLEPENEYKKIQKDIADCSETIDSHTQRLAAIIAKLTSLKSEIIAQDQSVSLTNNYTAGQSISKNLENKPKPITDILDDLKNSNHYEESMITTKQFHDQFQASLADTDFTDNNIREEVEEVLNQISTLISPKTFRFVSSATSHGKKSDLNNDFAAKIRHDIHEIYDFLDLQFHFDLTNINQLLEKYKKESTTFPSLTQREKRKSVFDLRNLQNHLDASLTSAVIATKQMCNNSFFTNKINTKDNKYNQLNLKKFSNLGVEKKVINPLYGKTLPPSTGKYSPLNTPENTSSTTSQSVSSSTSNTSLKR